VAGVVASRRGARRKDTGALQYDIYLNDDQAECIVLERYRDSEALIEHAAHLGDLSEAILATGSVSGEFLGEPSSELRAKVAESVVRLFTPYLSMSTPIAGLGEAAPSRRRALRSDRVVRSLSTWSASPAPTSSPLSRRMDARSACVNCSVHNGQLRR